MVKLLQFYNDSKSALEKKYGVRFWFITLHQKIRTQPRPDFCMDGKDRFYFRRKTCGDVLTTGE